MRITLFNPAPLGKALTRWGDYAFGRSLQKSLEALGARVTQRYWPEWTQDAEADVHLVLRGKRPFPGAHRHPAILWMVSHPSGVSAAEMSGYDLVLVGSRRHFALLGDLARTGEYEVAHQCTDFADAGGAAGPAEERSGVIFVANSRNIHRPVLRWALEAGVPVQLYGEHWKSFGLAKLVRSAHVENEHLPALYRQSRLALNDHWTDMRYFGYINNRLFDCMASGLPVITDDFAELHEVFGASLLYAHDRSSFLESWERYRRDYAALAAGVAGCWRRIGADYTFAARARRIMDIAQRIRGRVRPESRPTLPQDRAASLEWERLLAGMRKDARVVHVAPLHELDPASGLNDSISYATAGPGCGPWTVEADEALSAFARGVYDAVIIDDVTGWELADAFDARALLDAALRLLRKSGRLLVHVDSSLVRAARPGWTPDRLRRVSDSYFEHVATLAPAAAEPPAETPREGALQDDPHDPA